MFKNQIVGRLGLFLSISVLTSACGVGEIGDSAGEPRLDVGFNDVELTCPGVSADVSASDGWESKEASQSAPDGLFFEVMARPTEANLDALLAVGAQDIHDLSDAAITLRFSETGLIDVMDDTEYSSDGLFEYEPGVWYNIAISADVATGTYDVEIGRCGEKRQNVRRGARFRSAANVYDRLSNWGVWSSQRAALELSTPTWMASGTCAPSTCEALGAECGQPSDGCNGTLNCGVCGGGQFCSSSACVDEPVSVPPPPSCTPATCQSLGAECGAPSDGCGGTLNCGGCGAGQLCWNNVCADQPVTPPPPPPACVPTTCRALGADCGVRSNGCGGTLNCGGCGAGQLCSDSLCIDQPVAPPPPPACVPATCQALGTECGARGNGCGGTLNCGGCGAGQSCSGGVCVDQPVAPPPPPACIPFTCQSLGVECNSASDGCGGTLSCGGCTGGEICTNGQCLPAGSNQFSATRTSCMRPCAIQFDAQKTEGLTWGQIRDSEYIWDFDDGGSRTDAEGFLAAVVYETAGTYRPTVTVDGETWNPQTITVLDPARVVCVSPASDFSDCPSANGADRYTSLSAALSGTAGDARRHILLERGRGTYGSLPTANGNPSLLGAYSAGTNPVLTANNAQPYTNWAYQDVNIALSGDGLQLIHGYGPLLFLRVDASGATSAQGLYVSDGSGFFIVDSSLESSRYAIYGHESERVVLKNTTFNRTQSGQHTVRLQGGIRHLIQDSTFDGPGGATGLTVRGGTTWALVQNNTFYEASQFGSDNGEPGTTQRYIVWEQNVWDLLGSGALNISCAGTDVIIRNNVIKDMPNSGSGYAIEIGTTEGESPNNVWLHNNTVVHSASGSSGIRCNGTGCNVRNNLIYGSSSIDTCFNVNGSSSSSTNNWCYSTTNCLDPQAGGSGCYNPNFMSTNLASLDFVRPGSGTRGIDAGDQNVPVWDDLDDAPRSVIDVGAVER